MRLANRYFRNIIINASPFFLCANNSYKRSMRMFFFFQMYLTVSVPMIPAHGAGVGEAGEVISVCSCSGGEARETVSDGVPIQTHCACATTSTYTV